MGRRICVRFKDRHIRYLESLGEVLEEPNMSERVRLAIDLLMVLLPRAALVSEIVGTFLEYRASLLRAKEERGAPTETSS